MIEQFFILYANIHSFLIWSLTHSKKAVTALWEGQGFLPFLTPARLLYDHFGQDRYLLIYFFYIQLGSQPPGFSSFLGGTLQGVCYVTFSFNKINKHLGTNNIQCWSIGVRILSHSSFLYNFSCSTAWALHSLICHFIMNHIFSMGHRYSTNTLGTLHFSMSFFHFSHDRGEIHLKN